MAKSFKASKTEEEQAFWWEEKVHRTWSTCYDGKEIQESAEKEEKERNYVHLKKWVFLVLSKNPLTVAPAKKARFEK